MFGACAAEKHGKYVMKGGGFPWRDNARKFIDMGVRMIEVGHDVTILRDIWSRKNEEIKNLE